MASSSLTREQLYELVWSEAMLKVAARYEVSSSYMARVCTLLNVPRPERGYWAKLAVGKAPPKPPLPEARPGDESVWTKGGGSYSKKNRALPRPPSKKHKRKMKPSAPKLSKHPLINGAKRHFDKLISVHDAGYLKPTKKLLVDLVVSKQCLDKALSLANKLFLSLESKGHHVVIAPQSEEFHRENLKQHEVPKNYSYQSLWSPWRCTVVYIGTVAIGLTIVEMSEEREEKLAAEALKQSREQLFQIIDSWAEANRIDKFFRGAEQRANDLGDENKLKILERLQRARELIGSTEALEHFVRWRTPDEIYTPEL